MKLRNKKTGKIGNFCYGYTNELCVSWQKDDGFWGKQEYNSLAELNQDWEDYNELEYWYIDNNGDVLFSNLDEEKIWEDLCEERKQIGNHFDTKEEAEKAVEKLKAWKRLKEKGVELYGWRKNPTGTYDFLARWKDIPPKMTDIINDLDLLFGGEE